MGGLTPGATYIYERVDDTVYARESGADPSTRRAIGWLPEPGLYTTSSQPKSKFEQIKEDKLWGNIRRAAKDNPTLQEALERAILIYHLSKDKPNE